MSITRKPDSPGVLALLESAAKVNRNLPASVLIERAILKGEGTLANNGSFVVLTGKFTGRSPKDKYFVEEPLSKGKLWWGTVNQPLSEDSFDRLFERVSQHLEGKEIYLQDLYGGADIRYTLPVQVITEFAWHSLFAKQLLMRGDLLTGDASEAEARREASGFTLIAAPGCKSDPAEDGTHSETFIAIHLARRLVLIGGTEYAGEIKKSVFTLLNYLLPQKGVFPMHCSANIGTHHGDTALFFGLSGTGKTTLSADPHRDLIGDDEHGWSDEGVFNFEGGCYAKCIRLKQESEPQIWEAVKYGSVLENVVMNPETRELDYDSAELTENTRAAYPVAYIPNARVPGVGNHPKNVVFLTADAFGVLPPISRLTPAQAKFHFLSGYTAKVAGTERGMGDEPQATFSACFGQPFLPLHPTEYAELLGKKLEAHGSAIWLVNTGWSGGAYGIGKRMSLAHTRTMLNAAIEGALDETEFVREPVFGLWIPIEVPEVPQEILTPRNSWGDRLAYDKQAAHLAKLFVENFEKYQSFASEEVIAAAPRIRE